MVLKYPVAVWHFARFIMSVLPLQKFIPMLFIASAAERTLMLSVSLRKCSGWTSLLML